MQEGAPAPPDATGVHDARIGGKDSFATELAGSAGDGGSRSWGLKFKEKGITCAWGLVFLSGHRHSKYDSAYLLRTQDDNLSRWHGTWRVLYCRACWETLEFQWHVDDSVKQHWNSIEISMKFQWKFNGAIEISLKFQWNFNGAIEISIRRPLEFQ